MRAGIALILRVPALDALTRVKRQARVAASLDICHEARRRPGL
ncbi:hypothetical protein PATSB16_06780 [Pandoraea thiooxydans]|nr:hypothetical protein PATSB16_06780 [Pandoraea thiooxydans]